LLNFLEEVNMRRKILSIWLVLLVVVLSLTVLIPGCEGEGEPTTGTIAVNATLDGSPWPSSGTGAVEYTLTLTGGSPISGTEVPKTFADVDTGNWTCAYVSGGPGTFVDITTSATQSVVADETTTFTLNFVTPGPLQVDAYVTFLTWSINGTPIDPGPPGTVIWIPRNTWIDAEYEEHVSGEEEGEVVTVHQTSWLTIHNTGMEGSGVGDPIILHAVNHPGAVTMDPPAEGKANQTCTVEGTPVPACTEVVLEACQPVNLDVEVDWELKICTDYTKNINWIGYPSPEEILFDAVLVPPFYTVTLVSYACVEVGEGFEDTNPDNNCCDASPMLTIGFLP
jgi:hypothetical protein